MINYRVVRKMCVKNLQGKSTKESKGPLLPATSSWDPPGQLRLSLGGQRQMSGLHACLGAFLLSPPRDGMLCRDSFSVGHDFFLCCRLVSRMNNGIAMSLMRWNINTKLCHHLPQVVK